MIAMNGHGGDAHGMRAAPAMVPFTVPPVQQRGPASDWPEHAGGPAVPVRARRWRQVTRHRGWLAAVPVALVNSVAFAGQLAFLRTHLHWPLAGQMLVAVTLESVAVYLAWQAHLALAADDSAMRLRLAAYGFAAVIGVMNYTHYMARNWRPTFAAVTFGLMSVSSPWLWSVHSRRASRDALKARGLIEPHAVRLGATRWLWHPWRSARVMWHATWQGENDPAAAIALTVKKPSPVVPDDDSGDDRETDVDVPSPPPDDETEDDTADDRTPPPPPPNSRQPKTTGRAKAVAILKRNPGLSDVVVAKRTGVSERTVQRARSELTGNG